MSLFEKYMEFTLGNNEIEIQKDQVYGNFQGKDLGNLSLDQLITWLQNSPTIMKEIEDAGGIEAIAGSDNIADIKFSQKGGVDITPDSRNFKNNTGTTQKGEYGQK